MATKVVRSKGPSGAWETGVVDYSERQQIDMPEFDSQADAIAALEPGQFTVYVYPNNPWDGGPGLQLLAKDPDGNAWFIDMNKM